MKWVRDKTGRFNQRPYYDEIELDYQCEAIINQFLNDRHGKIEFPITTDDLTVLIETVVEDLDTGADLSQEEGEVEGLTEFRRGKKPVVKISRNLSGDSSRENRLRTTLTHEFTHVKFHGFLFEVETPPSLFD